MNYEAAISNLKPGTRLLDDCKTFQIDLLGTPLSAGDYQRFKVTFRHFVKKKVTMQTRRRNGWFLRISGRALFGEDQEGRTKCVSASSASLFVHRKRFGLCRRAGGLAGSREC